MVIRMVMVPWSVTDIKQWLETWAEWLTLWPERTGRVCPHCGAEALVGHGLRRRTVHVGRQPGRRGETCVVEGLWVQRVRCLACGKTHTLLPVFLAPYQRHASAMREAATVEREAGASWRVVLKRLRLAMGSTTSVRRWVQGVRRRFPLMAQAVARWRAAEEQEPAVGYGAVAEPGSFAAFVESVRALLGRIVADWPGGEAIAGANWQATVRRRAEVV